MARRILLQVSCAARRRLAGGGVGRLRETTQRATATITLRGTARLTQWLQRLQEDKCRHQHQ